MSFSGCCAWSFEWIWKQKFLHTDFDSWQHNFDDVKVFSLSVGFCNTYSATRDEVRCSRVRSKLTLLNNERRPGRRNRIWLPLKRQAAKLLQQRWMEFRPANDNVESSMSSVFFTKASQRRCTAVPLCFQKQSLWALDRMEMCEMHSKTSVTVPSGMQEYCYL